MTEKGGSKKSKPRKGLKIFLGIIIVLIIIILVLLFIFSRPLSNAEINRGIPDQGIDILYTPITVESEGTFDVSWRVLGLENIKDAKLFVSFDPQGELTEDSNIADISYANVVEPIQNENKFLAEVTAPAEGVMYLRIYATDGNTNYWSDELVVQVAE